MFTYGIGAIVDLPNLAAIVNGIEDWDNYHCGEIPEERLLAAVRHELGSQVKQLVAPPRMEAEHESNDPFAEANRVGMSLSVFPDWLVCPRCRLLSRFDSGVFSFKASPFRPNQAAYVHTNCPKAKEPIAIPARFMLACENGHLDDFPWRYFVHRGEECSGTLRLVEVGVSGSVSEIYVECDGCDAKPRLLSEAFGDRGQKSMPRCRGRHPHLGQFDEQPCKHQARALLLGASNTWFSVTMSALSIPKIDNKLAELTVIYWGDLSEVEDLDDLGDTIRILRKRVPALKQAQDQYGLEALWQAIETYRQGENEGDPLDIKSPEWSVFSESPIGEKVELGKLLKMRSLAAPVGFEGLLVKTIAVDKLREVRAAIGFTRIVSPGDFDDIGHLPRELRAPISRKPPKRVPASENYGEGIFIQFDETAVQAWEARQAVRDRANQARTAQVRWLTARKIDPDSVEFPGMRYLLIHSFSHALMRQLALTCGYAAASLRERIYAKPGEAGLLIYTAAPDSEGTLGGLVALAEPRTLGRRIRQALANIHQCSADPLCSERDPIEIDLPSLHWAACHSCLFAPETSCERGNKFLDRALLLPTYRCSDLAFFQGLV